MRGPRPWGPARLTSPSGAGGRVLAGLASASAAGLASAFAAGFVAFAAGASPSPLGFASLFLAAFFGFAGAAVALAPLPNAFATSRLVHARGGRLHVEAGLLERGKDLLGGDAPFLRYLVDSLLCHSVMKSKVSCVTFTGARKLRASGCRASRLAAQSGPAQT